jgi:iron-sulfur cluster assembly accessory protein
MQLQGRGAIQLTSKAVRWHRGVEKRQQTGALRQQVLYNQRIEGITTDMVQLTEKAIGKVKEILDSQEPKPAGLRIAVVGGGCSGFSYSMAFENQPNMLDKTYQYGGLKVFVDQASLLYLDGAEVDYVENLEGSGFKFSNPNVKSTCGCGSSFSA